MQRHTSSGLHQQNTRIMEGRPANENDPLLQQSNGNYTKKFLMHSKPQTIPYFILNKFSTMSGRSTSGLIINTSVHIVLLAFTFFVTYISFYKGIVLFSWHPPLMLLGVSKINEIIFATLINYLIAVFLCFCSSLF